MKTLFENRFIWSEDDTKALYFRTMLKSRRYITAFVFLAFSFIGIGLMLFMLRESVIIRIAGILLLCFLVFSLFVLYFKHLRFVKQEYNDLVKSVGGKAPELIIEVTKNEIISRNRDGQGGKVAISAILKVKEDKKRFFLSARTGDLYILRKDSFEKGTPDEFRKFLRDNSIY